MSSAASPTRFSNAARRAHGGAPGGTGTDRRDTKLRSADQRVDPVDKVAELGDDDDRPRGARSCTGGNGA